MTWSTGRPLRSSNWSNERTRGATLMNWGRAPTTLTTLIVIAIELRDGAHDVVGLVSRQFGIDGKRERLPGGAKGLGAVLGFAAEIGETLLEVQRDGVVDLRTHPGLPEVLLEVVPARGPNHILIEDVAMAVQRARRSHVIADARLPERGRVVPGVFLTTGRPPVQMLELDEQDGGLQLVEPEVAADDEMVIPGLAAVDSQDFQALRQREIVGHAHARVAERAQVLRRKEGGAADVADPAGATRARIFRADGLRRVLDHLEAVPSCQLHERVHLGHLAEQMDGHERLDTAPGGPVDQTAGPHLALARDELRDARGREVVRRRIDVSEERTRAQARDGAGGGEEAERGRDDLVAGSDLERHEGREEGVGPRREADAVPAAGVLGDALLELGHAWPENELLARADVAERVHDLGLDRTILRLKIEERHRQPARRFFRQH